MDKLLPRLQLGLGVLFAVSVICGPLFIVQANLIILSSVLAGILLGTATFLIGWRLVIDRSLVIYPFTEWSVRVLKPFLSAKQTSDLKPAQHDLSPVTRRLLGMFSLSAGLLLVIVLIMIAIFVLSA